MDHRAAFGYFSNACFKVMLFSSLLASFASSVAFISLITFSLSSSESPNWAELVVNSKWSSSKALSFFPSSKSSVLKTSCWFTISLEDSEMFLSSFFEAAFFLLTNEMIFFILYYFFSCLMFFYVASERNTNPKILQTINTKPLYIKN
uniref:Putative uncharacterized membrane protein YGR290W n=1 Tax=Saccharomyces cerevisiae (strain ATCC 204508 / S288c) TaxID=559292 RepID=YG61_YEAST|nr:RecName: Full=Putative uncharacterized membrane protein YGR290W [Saccharomyces cerevisiae S288C]AAT93355.1 YGR290W [Saccharomyces cerevisiae]CAA97323.1 unnamed protein product [Saccharomyces cerevisiae]